MDQLALHPQTRDRLLRFIANPSHALLLTGAEGMGKYSITQALIQELLGLASITDVDSYPYLRTVLPEKDKTTIGIEAIRELQHFTSLKLPGGHDTRRFIVIPQSDSMSIEAQNALLKLLEEPPQDTIFILTASSSVSILPTIESRVQILTIHRPGKEILQETFTKQAKDPKMIQQAFFMSGGLPGLMHALLNDEAHPLTAAAATARTLLQSGQFERLCMVDELSKKRIEALQVILVLRHMSQAALEQASQIVGEAGQKRLKQWQKVLQACYDTEKAYAVSAQAKLTLTKFMLSL